MLITLNVDYIYNEHSKLDPLRYLKCGQSILVKNRSTVQALNIFYYKARKKGIKLTAHKVFNKSKHLGTIIYHNGFIPHSQRIN